MDLSEKTGVPLNDTRAIIMSNLLNKDLTAIDLEEKLEINESAVRRHLDTLQNQGLVKPYFEKASKGRPKKMYGLTQSGKNIFPQKTCKLFSFMLDDLQERVDDGVLDKVFTSSASRLSENLAPDREFSSTEDKLEVFMDSLDEFGFFPEKSKENGFFKVEYKNCVFDNLDNDVLNDDISDKLCNMHKRVVENVMSDCEVAMAESEENGNCMHLIKPS